MSISVSKETANFFWHGALTNFEISCIKSFIRHGWIVQLWSYTGLSVDGAVSMDARKILPEDHLFKYNQYGLTINNDKDHPSLAAFSDVFRCHLLEQEQGWWFDCDCFCLKNVKEYSKLKNELGIILGVLHTEPELGIGTGILYLNKDLAKTMIEHVNKMGTQFDKWAAIGPTLVQKVLTENGQIGKALPASAVYPIRWDEIELLVEPDNFSSGLRLIKNSLMVHIWDTEMKLRGYDKSNPKPGSLLDYLFKL